MRGKGSQKARESGQRKGSIEDGREMGRKKGGDARFVVFRWVGREISRDTLL